MIEKQSWWKALGVIILLYVFVMGMVTPLGSGILEVEPRSIESGTQSTFVVNTYNTLQNIESTNAWIRLDSVNAIKAKETKWLSDNQLKITFDIPTYLPTENLTDMYSLIISDPENGAFVRPSALSITQKNVNLEAAANDEAFTNIEGVHIKDKMAFPFRALIYETIRNTYFHVPLWFAMVFIFMASMIQSGQFLRTGDPMHDLNALSFTRVGVLFGILGCVTGAIWAKNTWGTWWTFSEIKLNVSAIAMLIYLAYFVLRNSFEDEEKRARVSAVYNIFAFVAMVPLLFVIPRMVDGSLHPGNGGNPGFGGEDLDNHMRKVFYPAIIGWTLLGMWLSTLMYRIERLNFKLMDDE